MRQRFFCARLGLFFHHLDASLTHLGLSSLFVELFSTVLVMGKGTSRATTLVVPKRRSAHTPFIPFSISTQEVHSRPRRPAPGPSIRPSAVRALAVDPHRILLVRSPSVLVAGASQSQIAGWMERSEREESNGLKRVGMRNHHVASS